MPCIIRFTLAAALFLLCTINGIAQDSYTVSGLVKDSLSGETLIGVSIKFDGNTRSGTSTNAYGFFSYKLSPK